VRLKVLQLRDPDGSSPARPPKTPRTAPNSAGAARCCAAAQARSTDSEKDDARSIEARSMVGGDRGYQDAFTAHGGGWGAAHGECVCREQHACTWSKIIRGFKFFKTRNTCWRRRTFMCADLLHLASAHLLAVIP